MTTSPIRLSVIAGLLLATGLTVGCADSRYEREAAYRDRDRDTIVTDEETRERHRLGPSSDSGTFDYK